MVFPSFPIGLCSIIREKLQKSRHIAQISKVIFVQCADVLQDIPLFQAQEVLLAQIAFVLCAQIMIRKNSNMTKIKFLF
jgi:hypothetical protein